MSWWCWHFPGGFRCQCSNTYASVGASQFPYISGCQNINAFISSRVTGPHFLCACLVQLQLAGYGTYWFRPHFIGKRCIKKCSLPTVWRISMCWTRRWFSKWSVCWHNVISGPRNCRILLTSFMANSWKTFSLPLPRPRPLPHILGLGLFGRRIGLRSLAESWSTKQKKRKSKWVTTA